MKRMLPVLALAALALPTLAQDVKVFGGKGERAASTMIFFSDKPEGGISLSHGQPVWRDEYNAMLGTLSGKMHRLGKDWWTTFDNSMKLTIGGAELPAGSWFCGLEVDAKGGFHLVFLDSAKAMKDGTMPFMPDTWKVDHKVPLTMHKDKLDKVVEKMTMEIKGDSKQAELSLSWGKHVLNADVKVHLGGEAKQDAKPAK
ncbi:MAG: hypothetical protein RL148_1221 [Planctomycetota bacterium]|jgi:hypothetical protein